ncbi:interleukin-6 receptor subunit beta-like [Myripristis murdjan]|uniref:interleukin-6 receptor subunit beta-like n=1 Tax=Myripristis murdjan TaxID=586833 RepID=UPI0011763FAC|nr:interleukin-6 receptor subunit beta-like [Myripristis murdjan]
MEPRPIIALACLLGVCLGSVPAGLTPDHPRPLRLDSCVFQQRANITCWWESGDTQPFNTAHYTLKIERMHNNVPQETFSCTSPNNSCTVDISITSVAFPFCITVTAHSPHGDTSSDPRCQSGRKEVKLGPVTLTGVEQVRGEPECLKINWNRPPTYDVSEPEMQAGNLMSQLEVTAQGQPSVQIIDVNVLKESFVVCLFKPDTLYSIRLRHRFRNSTAPWSEWSNRDQGRTGEAAPSAAPAFWRQVTEKDESGWRHVSLFWKPLPHFQANGRVLFYNVTCQSENTAVLNVGGSCQSLNETRTSCSLRLPPERCSCFLNASNSAGTSPKAQIWLSGVSEKERPPPNQFTANPLDNNSVDVRWTAPADQPVSGFVVEWFAITEKTSSSLHWERLNSSSTAVVITEGVEPMKRYAISVTALYDEHGTGQSEMRNIYTLQGAPTAGPVLEVQKIFANGVDLIWSPIPVENRQGFIHNYTLYYTLANKTTNSVFVPGQVLHYSLKDLSPGTYDIYMQANTDAGAGAAGPTIVVSIGGSEEVPLVMIVVKFAILPIILTLLALVLMACLAQNEMVKQKLCQDIPDPSHSSLAHWTPKTPFESVKWPPMAEKPKIQYSEVNLVGENELQNVNQDLGYHTAPTPQTYSSLLYSSFKHFGAQTAHNTGRSEEEHIRSPLTMPTRAATTSSAEHKSYSHSLLTQPLLTLPLPLLSYSKLQPSDLQYTSVNVHDSKPQVGGESEPPASARGETTRGSDFSPSETDRLGITPLSVAVLQSLSPRLPHNALPPYNLRHVSHSSFSLPQSVEVNSPHHLFSPSHINSVPSLQPDPFSPLNSFSTSLSPFHQPITVDFSYSLLSGQYSVNCDPYISPGV